jgi:ribonuclease HI
MAINHATCAVLYTCGVSHGNPGQAGAGAVIEHPPLRAYLRLYCRIGVRTCNAAEYHALLMGLRRACDRGFHEIVVRSSSELLIKQLTGEYSVKHAELQPLHRESMLMLHRFERWQAEHVPRRANAEARRLANKALRHAASRNAPPVEAETIHNAADLAGQLTATARAPT